MSAFFELIAFFALIIGIAGVVYGTEVSKRCQQLIDTRLAEIEQKLQHRANDHEVMIKGVIKSVHETMHNLQETELSQSREIIAMAKAMKPLLEEYEERREAEKLLEKLENSRRKA